MTTPSLSSYDEVLKRFYLPAVQEQLNNETILMALLDKTSEGVDATTLYAEIHYGRTGGTGSRADGAALPTAGKQSWKQMSIPLKYHYAKVQFTGPLMAGTRSSMAAFVNVVDAEMNGAITDLKKELNRQLFGCGYGVLSRWRTTGSDTSYTVQKKYFGNTAGGDGFGSTFGGKYFKENTAGVPVVFTAAGSVVTVMTVDDTDIAVSAITESTDYDTLTVTNPAVTEAAGTFYVRPGNLVTCNSGTAAGAQRVEMMGLRGIVTNTDLDDIIAYDGTNSGFTVNDPLQGLAVATYPIWKANVLTHPSGRYAGQRALTADLMQRAFDLTEDAAGAGYGPDLIMTTKAIRREWIRLQAAQRLQTNTMELKGGFTGIDYNGVPITVDKDAIDGEIYFLTLNDLMIARLEDFSWMDRDGAILNRVSGYDAYDATLFAYMELACKRRNSQTALVDLQYSL